MRAVVIEDFSTTPVVRDLPAPVAPEHGVVLDVEATGVCRSDHHAWSGHDSTVSLPHVPGHELVGRVASAGPEVAGFPIGQRVTVPFVCGCGTCRWCRSGQAQVCPDQTQPGFTHFGSWADQVVIHHADANRSARPRRAMGGIYYSTRAKIDQQAQDEYLRDLGELMQEKSAGTD